MRRALDVLLVAAVGAVALAATWDALPVGEPEPAAAPARPSADLVRRVRALGATGQILFSDRDCVRRRLELPGLRVTEVPRITGCSVFGHRGSLGVVRGEVGWYAYPGGSTMLLTRPRLARAVGTRRSHVVAAAWLADTRYAALVDRARSRRLLALFDLGRLTRVLGELDDGFRELRSSPRGRWLAALDGRGSLLLYTAAGDEVELPGDVERPHAIAWSRDGRVAAVADAHGIVLFRPARGDSPAVRVDVPALDLAWRR